MVLVSKAAGGEGHLVNRSSVLGFIVRGKIADILAAKTRVMERDVDTLIHAERLVRIDSGTRVDGREGDNADQQDATDGKERDFGR